ncbi:inositol monophosphatase family protein [Alkalibacterium iburiense]|uniref:Inositol monophosphatase family protein n=1 Tax=Alkalibacterium iburiense TaxID=290589 RepID=A0ABN0XK71_9LACT
MDKINKRHKLVTTWIKEAAEFILDNKDNIDVEEKTSINDLVTNMDKGIEKELVKKIRETYPEDRIVSEEGYGDDVEELDGTVWFLDPIDGTLNFVTQRENYAVMIGIFEDGIGQQAYVYDVVQDKLYSAIKGRGVSCNEQTLEVPKDRSLNEGVIGVSSVLLVENKFPFVREIGKASLGTRVIGSAGLESVEMVKGNTVAYIAANLKPWDVAPGLMFMEELGMKATRFDNSPINLLENNDTVLGTEAAHRQIMDKINPK